MGLLGGVILALVLREVVLGAGQECSSDAGCDVTWVLEEVARVQCRAVSRPSWQVEHGGESEKKTEVGGDFLYNYNNTLRNFEFDNEDSNDTLFVDQFNSSSASMAELSEINKNLSEANNGSDFYLVDSISSSSNNFKNITKLELYLASNITRLDLSQFPNVKTVVLNTSGYVFSGVCDIQNVTDVSVTSSKVRDVSFVRHFLDARSLNISNNFIRFFPDRELPPTLVFLDISYNNIIFYTNVSLQDNMKFLNISYNNISNVEKVAIKGNLIVLDLSGNRLELVPLLETFKLEELYLSKNNITELRDMDFKSLGSLAVLDISENQLKHLESRIFQGLIKLQKLDLSENTILTFDPSNFQYLSNLVVLKLSQNNNLGSLQDAEDPSLVFGPGQRLQVIEASAINLSRLPSTLTRSVKKLLLADNTIHTIQCGELDSFPLLQEMDLSNNEVTEIEEDALGRLDFLSHLILSRNNLSSIPKSLPDQLEVLDLRCNFIQKVKNYEFLGMQNLRVLLLSSNLITTVEDGAFGQLTALEVLDLSHNPIKSLSRTSLLGPRRLKEIYLTSLTELIPLEEPLSFPAPESSHLEVLNLESSPVLASQLMDDAAALTMFHELFELNLSHCRLTTLRSDLPKFLPRLHILVLGGNSLNCSDVWWLVKWLQALNVSTQDKGKFRPETYHPNDACGKVSEVDHQEAMCAVPESLSGKQIIALKEEYFPDLKLTSGTHPALQLVEPYLATLPISMPNAPRSAETSSPINNSKEASSDIFAPPDINGEIDKRPDRFETTTKSARTILSSYSLEQVDTQPTLYETTLRPTGKPFSSGEVDKMQSSRFEATPQPTRTFSSNYYSLERPPTKAKSDKTINRAARKWKYLKSETKYKPSSSAKPVFVLMNDSSAVDNHHDREPAGPQFLAHGPPPASHPGMVLFLLIAGVVLGASATVAWSQCAHARARALERRHQDIEVASFAGTDLW